MLKRRTILEHLNRQTLLDLAYTFEIPGLTGKRKDDIVSTLARKRTIEPEAILRQVSRDDLKQLCEATGLDSSGRAKQPIIDRLLGRGDSPASSPPAPEPPAPANSHSSRAATKKRTAMPNASASNNRAPSRPDLDYADTLWKSADALRGQVDADVRRRFPTSIRNFFALCLPLADEATLWDVSETPPKLIATWERNKPSIYNRKIYEHIQTQAG